MPAKTIITDSGTGLTAEVVNGSEKNALVVATRPLKTFNNSPLYFTDKNGSKDMNVNVTYSGIPEKIHNGTDDILWTANAIVGSGRWIFNSIVQAHAGTHSIDASATINNDLVRFDKGANIDLSGYSAITGWVYLTRWTANNKIQMSGWCIGTGAIGNVIDINNYINTAILNTWQKFAIPLTDLGLEASILDSFMLRTIGSPAPNYYLDDLQIEEIGKPVEFTIAPKKGTWLHIDQFDITIVDEYSGILADATMPKIPYDGFLGLSSLAIGIIVQRIQNEEIKFQTVFKDLIDFMGLAKMKVSGYGSDGTNSWVKLTQKMTTPIILKSEDKDKYRYLINDNLSGLKKLWINVGCKEEIRTRRKK